jgi:3',5'-cyclic AMP phosphodiesterase CpdA
MDMANLNTGVSDSNMDWQASRVGDALTFAHLSDPHLSSLDHVKMRTLFNKRLFGYLSWRSHRRGEHRATVLATLVHDLQQRQPEHLVITGDLTHLGLPSEFQETAQWLQALGSATQVTVVPGNHDVYVRAPWIDTLAAWAPYMVSDSDSTMANGMDFNSLFPSLRVRGPVAFIGLSSAYPSAPFLATGRLGSKQLHKLETLLLKTGQQNLFRVLLIHHPPLRAAVAWRKRLMDSTALRSILVKCGIELVLHGHAHRAVWEVLPTRFANNPVVGVPAASASGQRSGHPSQYCLYRVQRCGQGWTLQAQVRSYSVTQQGFSDGRHKEWHWPVNQSDVNSYN